MGNPVHLSFHRSLGPWKETSWELGSLGPPCRSGCITAQPLSGAALRWFLQTQPLTPHHPWRSSSGWFCLRRSPADRRIKGTTWWPDQAAAPGRFGGLQKSYNSRGQQRALRTQTAPPSPAPHMVGSLPGSQRVGCERGGTAIAKQWCVKHSSLGADGPGFESFMPSTLPAAALLRMWPSLSA